MKMMYTQFMIISSREAMNALDASYPRLAKLYDRMMTSARIFTPPKIMLEPIEAVGYAHYPSDTIILDPHYVENSPVGHAAALIGHEAGHLLSECRPTYFTPAEILRAHEQEADQIAVHLTGSHDDVSVMRCETNHYAKNHWRPSNKLDLRPDSLMGRIAQRLDHLSPYHTRQGKKAWAHYLEEYGTPEELEANIRSVDLADRSHVDRLVAIRNQHTNPKEI